MRILHLYCLNYNFGDHALGFGVKNILRNYLEVDLISEVNIQGTVFDDNFIEKINREYDLLVIGGGGIIHGAHWPNGWFWLIDKERIHKITIPFIVYAAGYNYFKGEEGIPEKGIRHLQETFRYAKFFSVRNDGSYEKLKDKTGLDVYEIPDPGFHVGMNYEFIKPLDENYVIIQLAADKPQLRFGTELDKQQSIKKFREIIDYLNNHFNIILTPHVFEDVEFCKTVSQGLKNTRVWDFGSIAFDRTPLGIAYYKYAKFVLAMRGHAQILPISFNVPVISLENHDKNIGLMKKLGLERFNVNIQSPSFSDDTKILIDKITSSSDQLRDEYSKINKDLCNQTQTAMKRIQELMQNK